ncbi:MAG: hypothetical protein LBP41_03050 [Holosporaceae bacterium]|jgi:hypothetical protein|nr:hypothetical protein [Holosporaceae bacterium]
MKKKSCFLLCAIALIEPECQAASFGGFLDTVADKIGGVVNSVKGSKVGQTVGQSKIFQTATSIGGNIGTAIGGIVGTQGQNLLLVQSVKKLGLLDSAENSCINLEDALNVEIQRINGLIVQIDQEPGQVEVNLATSTKRLETVNVELAAVYQELPTVTDVARQTELSNKAAQLTQEKSQLTYEVSNLTARKTQLAEQQAQLQSCRGQYVVAAQTYTNVIPQLQQLKQNVIYTKNVVNTESTNGTSNTTNAAQYLKNLNALIPTSTQTITTNMESAQNIMKAMPEGAAASQDAQQTSVATYQTATTSGVDMAFENFKVSFKSLQDNLVSLMNSTNIQTSSATATTSSASGQ